MKIRSIIIAIVLGSIAQLGAQAPNWLWAKNPSGNSVDEINSIKVDAAGNVYMTGFYDGPATAFGTTTLTNSTGWRDIFVAKYDASGNPVWVKSTGGTGTSDREGYSIAIDGGGNSYVTGYFQTATVAFGTVTLNNAGGQDFFLVKYDPNGNVLWATSAGGSAFDEGLSVTTDPSGNVFVTGYYMSSSIVFGTYTLSNTPSPHVFTVKYDSNGNVLWAKSPQATSGSQGQSISCDAAGNAYVAGWFAGVIQFSTNLTSAGAADFFVVKYSPTGTVLWEKNEGSTSDERASSVCVDATGNVFVTGFFQSPTVVVGTNTLTNNGFYNVPVIKYDASGNVVWARNFGGTGTDSGKSLTTDANGNVYLTGTYSSTVMSVGTTTLNNAGGTSDIFITEYSAAGNPLWALTVGGNNAELINNDKSISLDAAGNIYIGGAFATPTIALGTTTLTKSGPNNVFDILLAKSGPPTLGVEVINANSVKDIYVYPNPSNGNLCFQVNDAAENSEIQILNSLGQIVHSMKIGSGINRINVNDLPKGLYYYVILQDKQPNSKGNLIIE